MATTSSPRSGSDGGGKASQAFALLHENVQRWIWRQNWTQLHPVQEAAIHAILGSTDDVIVSAATAGGKTEAAFLPVCSRLVGQDGTGIDVLCVSPLKALINDQFSRLEALCEGLEIPVERWHGDVPASRKAVVLKQPRGVLLITPESLEAIFVVHGPRTPLLFGGLSQIVIDELHAFIGSVRGRHLQSLLHRVELAAGRRVPRIGLSATLGDMSLAAEFLRARAGASVRIIRADDDTQEIRLQLRGYHVKAPDLSESLAPDAGAADAADVADAGLPDICRHLFATLRGTDNLVFANRRRDVELCADLLRRQSESARVPNEFWPHHGSLAADLREEAEARLKDGAVPATVVCTNTLELGIDVGHVRSIAQIGPPPSVASMRQRLGRSGRRGDPAVMRIYVREAALTPSSSPVDCVRADLVRAIAQVRLLVAGWYEPPPPAALHLSTLVQQVLSLTAEKGGTTALAAWSTLCETGPFLGLSPPAFADLLRAMAAADLLVQAPDGTLLPGLRGERIINHYSFFAAFQTPEEYRLVSGGKALGTLPVSHPLAEGAFLIFGGRRWKVVSVDLDRKVIDLQPTGAGRPPVFGGTGAWVHDRVRAEMRAVYVDPDAPAFLDAGARDLLAEARENFRRLALHRTSVVQHGKDAFIFCWAGDCAVNTLMLALWARGCRVAKDDFALVAQGTSPSELLRQLTDIAEFGPSDPAMLAGRVEGAEQEKYDRFLTPELRALDYASRFLDPAGAGKIAAGVVAESGTEPLA